MDKVLPPKSEKPGRLALAMAEAIRAEIARHGWTEENVVERADFMRETCQRGYVPGLGDVRPFPCREGLLDRLHGVGTLDLDDVEAVAFVLGDDVIEFAHRVAEVGQAAIQ